MAANWSSVWTAVAGLATAAAVVVAAFSAYFSWRSLRALGEPKVIVYVKHDADRPTLLCLVIENIGRDVAENVSFSSSRPIPVNAFGLPGGAKLAVDIMTAGPLVNGIPALGPGAPRVITWGQIGGLSAALGSEPIEISFTYSQRQRKFKGASRLEIESFMHTDASETPAATLARNTGKLVDHLRGIETRLAQLSEIMVAQGKSKSDPKQ